MPGPTKFIGHTVSEAAAFGAGAALRRPLEPGLQDLTNQAWKRHPSVPLDAFLLAEGVSQGQVAYEWAQNEAENTGISKARFDTLVNIANTGPGVGEAYRLWRRGILTEAGFRRAVKRAGLEQEWIEALVKAKDDVLDPGQLAAAIHRGLIPDPGLLKGEQPSGPRKVAQYPVYPIDAVKEAAASGYDHDRLGVLVGLQGLPMGVIEAAHAYYRGIITHGDYIAAFNESNNRNEWANAVLEYARQLPTARDFMENALRGHHDFDWAAKQAERFGMTRDDAFVIYQNQGRPLNLHQITQALAWGAEYKPAPEDKKDPWEQAVYLGAVRPEYYDMQEALKYNLPSAFFFRLLQQTGVLSPEEAVKWYLRLGWPPELAELVAAAFAKQTGGAAKDLTVSEVQALYESGRWTQAQALARLEELGYSAADAQLKLDVLGARMVVSQIDKAVTAMHKDFKGGVLEPAEALAGLQQLGVQEWAAELILATWVTEKLYAPD